MHTHVILTAGATNISSIHVLVSISYKIRPEVVKIFHNLTEIAIPTAVALTWLKKKCGFHNNSGL